MFKVIIAITLMGLTSLAGCYPPGGPTQTVATPSRNNSVESEPAYYICYKDDAAELVLSIGFDKSGSAILARHIDQPAPRVLKPREKQEYLQGGAYPTISDYYYGMVNGTIYGSYTLTHSGAWDYARYTPVDGGDVLSFTIDHDAAIEDGAYRTSECF